MESPTWHCLARWAEAPPAMATKNYDYADSTATFEKGNMDDYFHDHPMLPPAGVCSARLRQHAWKKYTYGKQWDLQEPSCFVNLDGTEPPRDEFYGQPFQGTGYGENQESTMRRSQSARANQSARDLTAPRRRSSREPTPPPSRSGNRSDVAPSDSISQRSMPQAYYQERDMRRSQSARHAGPQTARARSSRDAGATPRRCDHPRPSCDSSRSAQDWRRSQRS